MWSQIFVIADLLVALVDRNEEICAAKIELFISRTRNLYRLISGDPLIPTAKSGERDYIQRWTGLAEKKRDGPGERRAIPMITTAR